MELQTIELRKLIPSVGMVLTNGETFSKEVYLGCNSNASDWYEITEEEAERLQEEVNKEDE